MEQYYPQIIDELLKSKLRTSGAVLLKGIKWCCKSTAASQIAKSIIYMQELSTREHNIALAKALQKVFLTSSNLLFVIIYAFFVNINKVYRFSYFCQMQDKLIKNESSN